MYSPPPPLVSAYLFPSIYHCSGIIGVEMGYVHIHGTYWCSDPCKTHAFSAIKVHMIYCRRKGTNRCFFRKLPRFFFLDPPSITKGAKGSPLWGCPFTQKRSYIVSMIGYFEAIMRPVPPKFPGAMTTPHPASKYLRKGPNSLSEFHDSHAHWAILNTVRRNGFTLYMGDLP